MRITSLRYENHDRLFQQGYGRSILNIEVEFDSGTSTERLVVNRESHSSVPLHVLLKQAEHEVGAAIAAKIFRGVQP